MKDLKGKYVHCETLGQAMALMEEAERQGYVPLKQYELQEFNNKTTYNFNNDDNRVTYGRVSFYEYQYGVETIEFESLLEKDIDDNMDVKNIILNYLDSLHGDELLKAKLELNKMILSYKEE